MGESVVLDPVGNQVHRLNSSASYVWERCDGRRSVEEIAAELAAEHTIALDDVLADVQRVIREFGELGLLADGQP
jgi:hypothetical protein